MITLAEATATDIAQTINAIVASGDIDQLADAPEDVIYECARRYLTTRVRSISRVNSRTREQYAKVRNEATERLRQKTRIIAEDMARELHSRWSADILAGTFALPDGTRVSWGDATLAQHEARALHLEHLAAGDLQTASIHRQAMRDLTEGKVANLSELSS